MTISSDLEEPSTFGVFFQLKLIIGNLVVFKSLNSCRDNMLVPFSISSSSDPYSLHHELPSVSHVDARTQQSFLRHVAALQVVGGLTAQRQDEYAYAIGLSYFQNS